MVKEIRKEKKMISIDYDNGISVDIQKVNRAVDISYKVTSNLDGKFMREDFYSFDALVFDQDMDYDTMKAVEALEVI